MVGAGIGYGVQVAANLNQGMDFREALTTDIDPTKIVQGAFLGGAVGAGIGGVAAMAQLGAMTTGAATTAGTVAAQSLAADGDPTNEVRDVWTLNAFQRGEELHRLYGQNLPWNHKTIDRFTDGVATSIKSLDLRAKTYANPAALERTVTKYIDKVAQFTGTTWVETKDITTRALELIVPRGSGTQEQWDVLMKMSSYAQENGVVFHLIQH